MSTHQILIVPIKLEKHDNADSLSVVPIEATQCVVKTTDWTGQDRAIYVPPDYVVPSRLVPWLAKPDEERVRIKPVRLRGELSDGVLLPISVLTRQPQVGEDVMEELGITRYEPEVKLGDMGLSTQTNAVKGPSIPAYDLEPFAKYGKLFHIGEPVVVTEKIHGASAKFVTTPEFGFQVGSRNQWKADDPSCVFWATARNYPKIREFCDKNPNQVLFGEIYGPIQNLKYGTPNRVAFAAFDIYDLNNNEWWSFYSMEACLHVFGVPMVPVVYRGDFCKGIEQLAAGQSLIPGADHLREGIVIETRIPNFYKMQRLKMKIVSEAYYDI